MSAELFGRPAEKLKTIAITGTKGKTTTTAMIASILESAGVKTGTIGTLGILYDGKVVKPTTPHLNLTKFKRQCTICSNAAVRLW